MPADALCITGQHMAQTPTVHVAARVPTDLAAEFERMALSEDRTVSQALRQAMRRYLAENENGRPDPATALQGLNRSPASDKG